MAFLKPLPGQDDRGTGTDEAVKAMIYIYIYAGIASMQKNEQTHTDKATEFINEKGYDSAHTATNILIRF